MGRETKILLGLLGGLCCGLVVALVAKLLIVRPPEGAGVDVHPPERSDVGHITVEPPDYGGEVRQDPAESPDPLARSGLVTPTEPAALSGHSGFARGAAPAGPEGVGPSKAAGGVRLAVAEESANADGFGVDGGPSAFRFAGAGDGAGAGTGDGAGAGTGDGAPLTGGFAEAASAEGGLVAGDSNPAASTGRRVPAVTRIPPDPKPDREIRVGSAFVVAEGDTWWSVAERAYGDGRWYRPLYAWNKTLDPRLALRPGTRIVLPTENELEAAWAALVPERDRGAAPGLRLRPAREPHEAGEVVVREGDTLLSLAREHLGSASRWRILHSWNRDRLQSSPGPLSPGMVLRLAP